MRSLTRSRRSAGASGQSYLAGGLHSATVHTRHIVLVAPGGTEVYGRRAALHRDRLT